MRRFAFCVFYLLWAGVSLVGAEYLVFLPMSFILGSNLSQPAWSALYSLLSYALAVFFTLYIPSKLLKKPQITRELLGLKGLPKWADIALAPIGLVVYAVLATGITKIFENFTFYNAEQAQNVGFNNLYFASDKIFAFLALTLVAPIAEELIFRGWLYAKLRAKIPGKISLPLSILLTSLLFALLHGQWNVGVNVFCLSLILCALREVTGTIYSGILLHMLKNALAFFLLYMV